MSIRRPTIALCLIAKNEVENLPRLLESNKDCFDEIHITDTGSTDGTIELVQKWTTGENPSNTKVFLHHFEWINDFGAARNYSFSHANTDYICWEDCDDVLSDRQSFIRWRDDAMGLADYWLATYDYASDNSGNPVVSFARERVIKRSKGFKWNYFVHEGISPVPGSAIQYITTWKVIHKRTVADIQKDKFRNLKIFEANKSKIDHRMRFYYGKELFEAQKPMEAFPQLMEAVTDEKLEHHDRVMGIQYACYCLQQCNQFDEAIKVAHQGLQIAPNRAEFMTVIGDCYLKKNKFMEAIPYFSAAKNCPGNPMPGDIYAGPTFSFADAYGPYPRNQLARIYFNTGDFERALKEANECFGLFKNAEAQNIMAEIEKAMKVTDILVTTKEVDEIVISTPPSGAYEWDEEKAKTKGMGGSETAAIEMAKHLKQITGLPVKIFNMRDSDLTASSGVEYLSVKKLNEYLSKFKPKIHIAWRHNSKLTQAYTYLWCHDLVTPGVERVQNFDKMLCLSPFHKRYVQAMQGISDDKIILTRNGIDPSRFTGKSVKNPNKIIFPSSPDRGLDRSIKIVELARYEKPDLELHVFYGFDNLRKYGLSEMADKLEKMISERPWVKYHGFTEQKELAHHMEESSVWLYPANFIESFCITAIEALAAGCYPLVREIGALQDTLKWASDNGMATLLDFNCETDVEYKTWAKSLVDIIDNKSWEKIKVNPSVYSWESVAKEWVGFMGLEEKEVWEARPAPELTM